MGDYAVATADQPGRRPTAEPMKSRPRGRRLGATCAGAGAPRDVCRRAVLVRRVLEVIATIQDDPARFETTSQYWISGSFWGRSPNMPHRRYSEVYAGVSPCRRRDSNPRHADYDSGADFGLVIGNSGPVGHAVGHNCDARSHAIPRVRGGWRSASMKLSVSSLVPFRQHPRIEWPRPTRAAEVGLPRAGAR